jgi:hypothetical protein
MRPLLTVMLVYLTGFAGSNGESARRQQSSEADLLADAELFYEMSGGFAGVVTTARLFAKAGEVTAEYASNERRSAATAQSAPLEAARYLKLWDDAEGAGVWTFRVAGKPTGADEIRHELRVRAGRRRHSVSWNDGDISSPAAQSALRIGGLILALARETTTER